MVYIRKTTLKLQIVVATYLSHLFLIISVLFGHWCSWAVKKGNICQKMVNSRACHEIFLEYAQMQDLKVWARDLKVRTQCKINSVVHFVYVFRYI